jgi:hypothetical protein
MLTTISLTISPAVGSPTKTSGNESRPCCGATTLTSHALLHSDVARRQGRFKLHKFRKFAQWTVERQAHEVPDFGGPGAKTTQRTGRAEPVEAEG